MHQEMAVAEQNPKQARERKEDQNKSGGGRRRHEQPENVVNHIDVSSAPPILKQKS
jgi:hypothetical protein